MRPLAKLLWTLVIIIITILTSLPPVIKARNLKPISNPVKCFLVAMFAGQEHTSEAEHKIRFSIETRKHYFFEISNSNIVASKLGSK